MNKNEKGLHDCCECSQLETKIRVIRSQLESGLMDESDCHEQVKVLILRDMFDQYRNEFMVAISKLSDELEESVDQKEETEQKFRNRCFGRFESLFLGVPQPKSTDKK
tara:strand:+ start:745 stop:1068 length:324 start_codon:yes stop_codon:yes gene_type:complete